jgi:tRNA(Arg) A34 adenosine deaminase TadA
MDHVNMLKLAAKIALPVGEDYRNFWLGCIGIRKDGVLVSAKNGAVHSTAMPQEDYRILPNSHAECRTLRKLGRGGVLYVARVAKHNHRYACSRPCIMCENMIRSYHVKKVFYTINEFQYGVWDIITDYERVFNF